MIFKFKKFEVRQQQSAAKITTDATIFAAWMPVQDHVKNILEIGTGTGVLSLMLAQRYPAKIQAVEIDDLAFKEAKVNFENAPFASRLEVFHTPVQDFDQENAFEVVFTNPPFFQNNLKSKQNERKNIAYHTDVLSFEDLAISINKLLKDDGIAFVMLPHFESTKFDQVMESYSFFPNTIASIRHHEDKKILRRIVGYKKEKTDPISAEEIIIRTKEDQFTKQYKSLMKDFLIIF